MATEDWELEDNEEPAEQLPNPARQHLRNLEKDLEKERKVSEERALKLQEYERRDRFEVALEAAKVDVSLDEVSDLPTDQITPAVLKAKYAEKEAAKEARLAQQAEDAGFESVEDYNKALEAIKAQQTANKDSVATQVSVASLGPGAPEPDKPLNERKWEAYNKALAEGKTPDEARAELVRIIREDAMGIKSE